MGVAARLSRKARSRRGPASPGGKEPRPWSGKTVPRTDLLPLRLLEELPVDQCGQRHLLMVHVDSLDQPRAKQIDLLWPLRFRRHRPPRNYKGSAEIIKTLQSMATENSHFTCKIRALGPFQAEPCHMSKPSAAAPLRASNRPSTWRFGGLRPCVAIATSRNEFPLAPASGNQYRAAPWRGAGVVERGGLENRCPFTGTQGSNPCLSATCPRESVLPIRLRPDFLVVFEGYAEGAKHRPCCQKARKRSLRADILRT